MQGGGDGTRMGVGIRAVGRQAGPSDFGKNRPRARAAPSLSRPDQVRDAQDAAPPRSGRRGAPLARALEPRRRGQPASFVPRSPPAWSASSYCAEVRRLPGRRSSAESAVSASRLSPLPGSRNPSAAPPSTQSWLPARRARPSACSRGAVDSPGRDGPARCPRSGRTTFYGGRTLHLKLQTILSRGQWGSGEAAGPALGAA